MNTDQVRFSLGDGSGLRRRFLYRQVFSAKQAAVMFLLFFALQSIKWYLSAGVFACTKEIARRKHFILITTMSLHSTAIDPKYLPNLPGFRPRQLKTNAQRTSCFDIINGEAYLRPQYIPPSSEPVDDASVTSIGNTIVTKARKQVLAPTNVILNYSAYFEEYVEGQRQAQVRYCNIYFYVENGTIKVVEKPQVNSGVSQGTLVRRTMIARPDGNPYCEDDLRIGNVMTIYGRHYKYVSFLLSCCTKLAVNEAELSFTGCTTATPPLAST